MKFYMLFLFMLLFAVHAHASGRKRFCEVAVSHHPAPDVNYQAGVDVNGNLVVPADTDPAIIQSQQPIEIPITIDFAQELGLSPSKEMAGHIAALQVYSDGSVSYNGTKIEPTVMTLCAEPIEHSSTPSANDGQDLPPALGSPLNDVINKAINNDAKSQDGKH
jgi:hypothetical protein